MPLYHHSLPEGIVHSQKTYLKIATNVLFRISIRDFFAEMKKFSCAVNNSIIHGCRNCVYHCDSLVEFSK